MHHKKYSLDLKPPSKYNYSLNMQPTHSQRTRSYIITNDNKIGATRTSESSLFMQSPLSVYSSTKTRREAYSTSKMDSNQRKGHMTEKKQQKFYLPSISNHKLTKNLSSTTNPQQKSLSKLSMSAIITSPRINPSHYYQSLIYHSFRSPNTSSNYLSSLAGNHFLQSIQALKIGKHMKISGPEREIKLSKKNPKFKTIYLDLDQTLIHCDQSSSSYTVQLSFPIEGTTQTITAGIRLRPHCRQFLQQLSKIAQVIIFTASSQSYADVILGYLDPENKIFAHRLYRHHCKLEKGYYTKDLRLVTNRRMEDCLLVDNSAHCFMLQPYNGVPVIPFYHYHKDKQLPNLLKWLKEALQQNDVRNAVKKTFFWHKYFQNDHDPKKVFLTHFENNFL